MTTASASMASQPDYITCPASVNVRLSAVRKLVAEAADNGLLAPETAAAIGRAKGVKRHRSAIR